MCLMHILFFRVILNVVKNLETQSGCIQILRDVQNDILVGHILTHFLFIQQVNCFP